ncbi:topless-related protein 1-like isoform X2 [Punica granatum]|uniref:Topless-related protein 1-like isoform X2 n=2 Tax=Punica granatum TaxID=22663 RepID=A0A6P8BTX9_PUNGR|nr:topless-related protein 1-like isoform X2 [Punica granatum]
MPPSEMTLLKKELLYLILQFLNEEGYNATARLLEQESASYFYMDYFEELVLAGKWEVAEMYLSAFTKYDDNRYSTKIYFEMRKQNFLEALDENNRHKALDILMRDLKVFAAYDDGLFKEMTQLLSICNIREYKSLSAYKNAVSARAIMMTELRKIIEANPIFYGKLKFPAMKQQRLKRLINQGLNWQHSQCLNPRPIPDIKTLFEDHICSLPEISTSQPVYDPLKDKTVEAHSFGWPTSASTVTHSVAPNVAISVLSSEGGCAQNGTVVDNDTGPTVKVDKVPGQESPLNEPNDLPETVISTVYVDSFPTSVDFHPTMQSLLLVGTEVGDISLWEVFSGDKIWSGSFKVWDVSTCSMAFKRAMFKDPKVSIIRVTWSPDGDLFGAAYSKNLVQLYSYLSDGDVKQHLEIDAHDGAVTDLAFSEPEQQLLVITGGVDKIVKVWDAMTGAKKFSFEGHNATICSICPHSKDGVNFIFSTSEDGKIKAWLYDHLGARVDYDAPGLGVTFMAYGGTNSRLFSCGTNLEGESFLVEWDENEGYIRRRYKGLAEKFVNNVHFAASKNKYLAAGDDFRIKFWDMDHDELLTTADADGDLPVRPQIRFNKDGTLLAAIAVNKKIRIFGTSGEHDSLQQRQEHHANSGCEVLSEALKNLAINGSSAICNLESTEAVKQSHKREEDSIKEEPKPECTVYSGLEDLKFHNAYEPSHCLSLGLSSSLKTGKISKLIYTNAGNAILALASDAVHLMWKWPQDSLNPSGTATVKSTPHLWHPKNSSNLMTNQLTETPPNKVLPCMAISRNDSYLLSASGGTVSLFNIPYFKVMINFMPTPPAATCLAFYPRDNNVIAIGMDDFSIVIHNARSNKIITKLKGHKERVTGLAFSDSLNVLVSSGGDAQIILWEAEEWQKQRAQFWQHPDTIMPLSLLDTSVQFHRDQRRFLSANSTSLAIYDAKDLQREVMWSAGKSLQELGFGWAGGYATPIIHATFSCDGQMVYAGFGDGSVGVFDILTLDMYYRISQNAYIPQIARSDASLTAIAAHPQIPTQFAVGLSDGRVYIVEPPGDKAKWGPLPLDDKEVEAIKAALAEANAETNPVLCSPNY